jgi:hypothetical protein
MYRLDVTTRTIKAKGKDMRARKQIASATVKKATIPDAVEKTVI